MGYSFKGPWRDHLDVAGRMTILFIYVSTKIYVRAAVFRSLRVRLLPVTKLDSRDTTPRQAIHGSHTNSTLVRAHDANFLTAYRTASAVSPRGLCI